MGAAVLHAVQAVAVLALATGFALPVTASYRAGPPGTPAPDPVVLLDIPTGLAVAGFLALSALAHLIVCTAWWQRYVADLGRQRNLARRVEYSLSTSGCSTAQGAMAGLSVRREGLHRAEPHRHVRLGLADLRRHVGFVTATLKGDLEKERE